MPKSRTLDLKETQPNIAIENPMERGRGIETPIPDDDIPSHQQGNDLMSIFIPFTTYPGKAQVLKARFYKKDVLNNTMNLAKHFVSSTSFNKVELIRFKDD